MSHKQYKSKLTVAALTTLTAVTALGVLVYGPFAFGNAATQTAPLVLAATTAAQPSKATLPGLPPRPAAAMTGTEFAKRTQSMTGRQRQVEAVAQILRGNVPNFLRTLAPVPLEAELADGKVHHATLWVTPDYMAIGSDADFLRMPLTLPSISRICERIEALPPTPRMVDVIWRDAQLHVQPVPMPPGPQMRSMGYYLNHRNAISKQLPSAEQGELVAGLKKDVVLTNRLAAKPGRIAIYGWHRTNGEPIQPLSTIHGATYADYSHGLRLVADTLIVDGEERRLQDVLADPILSALLSDEGPIADPKRLLRGRG